jgi:hypothetical protein
VRLQDLVFREDADGLPAGAPCNYCGARGATLSAEVPLPGGHTALIALCSRGCESALKREKDGDKWLASFLAEAERMCAGADEQWPEEIDVSS